MADRCYGRSAFYDGNGRTGRILCVLYLVKQRLLDIPVLYLSRRILSTKPEYYRLLQTAREHDTWEDWVIYMLAAVEDTARQGIATVHAIKEALLQVKHRIRSAHRFYSQDLINNLFLHPYTKIDFVKADLDVTRLTATRYLDALVADGILEKRKGGRTSDWRGHDRSQAMIRGVLDLVEGCAASPYTCAA